MVGDEVDDKVDREVERPVFKHPHDGAVGAEVPDHLCTHGGFLHFDSYPALGAGGVGWEGVEAGAVDLGDARACNGLWVKVRKDASWTVGRGAELGKEDGVNDGVGDLRGVVEERGKLCLHWRGEEGGIGADGLADLDVEATVGGEEIEDALGDALVEVRDLVALLRGEVELVVEGYEGALRKVSVCVDD